jgi:hypothetical protein
MNKLLWVPRLLAAVFLVGTFVWVNWFRSGAIGYQSETRIGVTHVVALLAVTGIAFFALLMTKELRVGDTQPTSLKRRFVALLFDMWFLLFSIVGISSVIHLVLEANRSGTFKWQYERTSAAADFADTAVLLVNLSLMVLYFILPWAMRRTTVGCWIFRLATVDTAGNILYLPFTTALRRVFMEFRGLISPIKTIKERDAQGRTWYDRETGFVAVKY